MRRALGDDVHLMLRTHYLDSWSSPRGTTPFATDVSRHHDVTELMLLADVLVTDYSSVMFDFANTGRPMVFFTYDYEDYVRDERGTYLDLPRGRARSDGRRPPTSWSRRCARSTTTSRATATATPPSGERFCEYETGHAAEHVVEEFFDRRGRS